MEVHAVSFIELIRGGNKMKKYLSIVMLCVLVLSSFTSVRAAQNTTPLGPLTPKDVVYQIITDRFYDGDITNNIPSSAQLFDDSDNNNKGDGNDLKLYQGGDFQGIIDKIPYLKGMGVTAVWISAPYENRDTAIVDYQSGGGQDIWTSFHGYHVRNYFATNKHFGTMQEFEQLRDALHANNIKLVIDFVTNHSSRWQNPTDNNSPEDGRLYEPDKMANGDYAFDTNGEPVDFNGDGNVENLLADPHNDTQGFFHGLGDRNGDATKFGFRHKELGSLADYSQENTLVIEHLEKAAKFWVDKGIDGLRHDATLHMNPAFVKGLKDSIDSGSNGPISHFGEFFIGRPDPKYDEYESFPDRTGVNNLDFEFFRSITSTFGDFSTSMSDFGNMLNYTSSDYTYENQAITFIDNHDVTRFGYHQGSQKVYNAALVALLASRGTPNIYYGTEQYMTPNTSSDIGGRMFMETSSSFDTTTDAYKLIGYMSDLRQENDALAYGTTEILFSNNDVLVMKRKFFEKEVLIAINRQPDQSISVNQIVSTGFADGNYDDKLNGIMQASGLSVTNGGNVYVGTLPGGYAGVWSYNANSSAPELGDVVSTMGRAGNSVYIYGANLDGNVTVKFNNTPATIISNSNSSIEAIVPNISAGEVDITVTKNGLVSNVFKYTVLSGDQVQVIFHVNATTSWGENVYVIGNVPELGSWDVDKCSEAMMTPNYPEWFLPVSVPANTTIEFKFIKKDSNGNVVWESGSNRIFTSTSDVDGASDTPIYNWQ